MSTQQAETVQESVRAKVRTALTKTLNAELATSFESKLSTTFPTTAAYTSAYRSLVLMLKPRSDTLAPDASLAPAATAASQASSTAKSALRDSTGLPATGEFANLAADLKAGKVKVGHVLNKLQEVEKTKAKLLKEATAPAATATGTAAAASSNGTPSSVASLDAATAAAVRARGIGLLTQRINSAKARVEALTASGATSAREAVDWEEVADCSMQMFYQHAPNEGWLLEALKAYNRVESLSTEHVHKFPAFYLKRSQVHVIMENFEAALQDLEKYASREGSVAVPAATADSAAAAAAAPTSLSYAAVAAPRLHTLRSFVSTTSRLLASRMKMSEEEVSTQLVSGLPNPSERELKRQLLTARELTPGPNENRAVVLRLVSKLDQSALWSLASNLNPRVGASLNMEGAGRALPLPNLPYDGLESRFRTPSSYVAVDTQGQFVVVSLYNLNIDPSAVKAKKALLKSGASLILLDPTVVDVAVEGEKGGHYRVIQVRNPYAVFADKQQVFTASDIAQTTD